MTGWLLARYARSSYNRYLLSGYHERSHNGGTFSDNLNHLRSNVHEEHEGRYRTAQLAVIPRELVNTVTAVGLMAADVRKYRGK